MTEKMLVGAIENNLNEYLFKNNILPILNKFFSENICIPKGTEVQLPISGNGHVICNVDDLIIKPSEPTYEWQWYLMPKTTKEVMIYMASNSHLTDDEAKEWISKHVNIEHFLPIKIEETKRIRE